MFFRRYYFILPSLGKIFLLAALITSSGCTFNHQEERTITPVYNIVGEHVGDVVDENDHAYIKFLN